MVCVRQSAFPSPRVGTPSLLINTSANEWVFINRRFAALVWVTLRTYQLPEA